MSDLTQVTKEIDQLLAEDVEKSMTADEFSAYAKDQMALARTERGAGEVEKAQQRLVALKAEADKVAKFEFKSGELPSVRVFRDKGQMTTTETTQAPKSQQVGGPGFGATAKEAGEGGESDPPPAAAGTSEVVDETKGGGGKKPKEGEDEAKGGGKKPKSAEADNMKKAAWPSDMAKDIPEDLGWGTDGTTAAE